MSLRMERELGQDLVEYALVLPLFLLLILGIFEFSLLYFQYITVANAAREAARAGIVTPTESCDQGCIDSRVRDAARRLTAGLAQDDLNVVITHPSLDVIRVDVSYATALTTQPLIQAVGGDGSLTLRSSASMHRER